LNVGPARSTLRRKSGNFDLQSEKEWINEALVFILAVGIVFAGRLTQEFLWQLELLSGSSKIQRRSLQVILALQTSLTSKTLKSTDLNRCKGSAEIEQISSSERGSINQTKRR
jgi:hypothetical protein